MMRTLLAGLICLWINTAQAGSIQGDWRTIENQLLMITSHAFLFRDLGRIRIVKTEIQSNEVTYIHLHTGNANHGLGAGDHHCFALFSDAGQRMVLSCDHRTFRRVYWKDERR